MGQAIKIALQLVALIVLSRILSPSEFGIAAMLTAIVAVGEVLRDFGLSTAAIQAKNLTAGQRDNLLWLSAALGGILAVALAACAPWISSFYDEPRASDLTVALAPAFLITALGAQFRASLIRELRFRATAFADTLGYASGVIAAIAAAVMGAGVWALVIQQLLAALVATGCLVRAGRWIPRLPRRRQGTASLLGIGRNVFLTQLLGNVSRNVDSIIIGRMFGASALGYYNRGFQMVILPMSQINAPATSVALPVLSRVRDDHARFNELVLRAQAALLVPLFALLGTIVVLAPDLVQVLLGAGWEDTVTMIQILGCAAAFQGASYVSYWVFVARSLTAQHLRFTLLSRPLFIAALLLGTFGGMPGVAAAYAGATGILWAGSLWWIRATEGLAVGRILRSGCALISAFAAAALAGLAATAFVNVGDGLWRPILGVTSYGLTVGALCVLSRSLRSTMGDAGAFVRTAIWTKGVDGRA